MQITKYSYPLFLYSLILMSLSGMAAAETLTGAVIDLKPWGYKNSQGDIYGSQVTFLKKLEKKTGISFQYSLKPLKRISSELLHGKTDFGMLFKRESYRHAVVPVAEVEDLSLYLLYRTAISEPTSVGVLLGQEQFLVEYYKQLQLPLPHIITVNNNEQLYKLMQTGRIEVALTTQNALNDFSRRHLSEKFFVEKRLVKEKKVYFFMAINSPNFNSKMVEEISKGIAAINKEEEMWVVATELDSELGSEAANKTGSLK